MGPDRRVGVGRIILSNAERVERDYFDAHILTPACYRPLLVEGLQQARDTRVPAVSIHKRFKVLVEDELDGLFEADGLRLVADPSAPKSVGAAIGEQPHRAANTRILIATALRAGTFEIARLERTANPSAWARARCAPTRRAWRCSRSLSAR